MHIRYTGLVEFLHAFLYYIFINSNQKKRINDIYIYIYIIFLFYNCLTILMCYYKLTIDFFIYLTIINLKETLHDFFIKSIHISLKLPLNYECLTNYQLC
jgi:hypothetical protein